MFRQCLFSGPEGDRALLMRNDGAYFVFSVGCVVSLVGCVICWVCDRKRLFPGL